MGRASAFIDQTVAISPNVTLKDCWVWGADPKGIFSTNSAYLCIKAKQFSEDQSTGFCQLWDIKIPPKALSFLLSEALHS